MWCDVALALALLAQVLYEAAWRCSSGVAVALVVRMTWLLLWRRGWLGSWSGAVAQVRHESGWSVVWHPSRWAPFEGAAAKLFGGLTPIQLYSPCVGMGSRSWMSRRPRRQPATKKLLLTVGAGDRRRRSKMWNKAC